jgi:hypothetical protein
MSRGANVRPGKSGKPRLKRLLAAPEECRHELGELVGAEGAQTSAAFELLQERARRAPQAAAELQDGGLGVGQPFRRRDGPDAVVHGIEAVGIGEVLDPQAESRR